MSVLKEGYPFIFPFFLVGLALFIISIFFKVLPVNIICISLGSVLVVFSVFCVYFFRDPKIRITMGDGIILSPCNGTVIEVVEENGEKVIRVFLSIFSVHLQRSPVSGTVVEVSHKDGKFLAAWDPKAHIENEQNIFVIQGDDAGNSKFTVRQIAGLLARRCVSWVKQGDVLKSGDKIGMIKFSSQVDLHLPLSASVNVKAGDKTKAGITVVANFGAAK